MKGVLTVQEKMVREARAKRKELTALGHHMMAGGDVEDEQEVLAGTTQISPSGAM